MQYTSRVPRVTISPVLAPFLSISVLMAVVEPWISSVIAAQSTPLFFRQSTMPWTSLAGVVSVLACESRPVVSSNAIRSVKVPPISIATSKRCVLLTRLPTLSWSREQRLREAPLPLVHGKRCVPARSRRGVGRPGPRRPDSLRVSDPGRGAGRPVLVDDPQQARELPAGLRRLRPRQGRALRRARRQAAP